MVQLSKTSPEGMAFDVLLLGSLNTDIFYIMSHMHFWKIFSGFVF